jgi:uncharacterized membrane protein (UPF0127 family)
VRRRRRALLRALAAGTLGAFLAVSAAAQEPAVEPLETFPRSNLEIESSSARLRFDVWVADTAARRSQGLMFVKRLAPKRGMLFLYREPQVVSMWMKNTLIPLDMLFVAADGHIIRIAPRTTPHSLASITSMGPVTAVIEIAGGEAERLGIVTGARVVHPIFTTMAIEH